jgi:hypothetical protein
LSSAERRVLILRAGVGSRAALSRPQVARRLGLGVAQTRRIERRGLRRLDALAGAGRCGVGAGAGAGGGAVLLAAWPGGGSLTTGSALGGAVAGGAADPARPAGRVEGVSESGGPSHSGPGLPPFGQGRDFTLLIGLALLVALALLVRRELLRR